MRFLLINSPLVTPVTWLALVPFLKARGHDVSVVPIDNRKNPSQSFAVHHLQQVNELLYEGRHDLADTIVIAHSGAGPILASFYSKNLAGYVMLDAIFPVHGKSRFELFDSQEAVEAFKQAAIQNDGNLPIRLLRSFGKTITDKQMQADFESPLKDVPISLYEEPMNVRVTWPEHPGLYIQWTDAYRFDLERARQRGFNVRHLPGSHFEMLNAPEAVGESILEFSKIIEMQDK